MIRGLTLTHPWAFCIARLGKDVENRRWRPERHGGRAGMYLAIHGGVVPKSGAKLQEAISDVHGMGGIWPQFEPQLTPACRAWLADHWLPGDRDVPCPSDFFTPGIVAVARLAGVAQDSSSLWAARGQYHWQLADVVTLPEPIPHRGAQGLWTIEPAALEQLRKTWKARTNA